jgi:hypothetical protein
MGKCACLTERKKNNLSHERDFQSPNIVEKGRNRHSRDIDWKPMLLGLGVRPSSAAGTPPS